MRAEVYARVGFQVRNRKSARVGLGVTADVWHIQKRTIKGRLGGSVS